MTPILRSLAIALGLCLASLGIGAGSSVRAGAGEDGIRRQILVMVKLAPAHLRPNYEQGSGYGDDPGRNSRRRHAARIARKLGLTVVDSWPMPLVEVDCFVMNVPDDGSVEDLAARASRESGVLWAQPVQTFRTQGAVPSYDDPLFPAQPAVRAWRLAELHQIATGRGITIAMIDSGIDTSHPDFRGQVVLSRNFVDGARPPPELHGTAVAGIIVARANNKAGIVGVAPQARLLALRACRQQDRSQVALCDSLSLARALHFAIENKADVINLSLGGPQDLLLAKLLQIGLDRGAAVVASYHSGLPRGGFPASLGGVIAVSDQALPRPDAAVYTAPARDVPTTLLGGRWYLVSGNSYAAAHVAGLVALMRGRQRRAGGPDLVLAGNGKGTIDACATLVRVAMPCDCACASAAGTPRVAGRQASH